MRDGDASMLFWFASLVVNIAHIGKAMKVNRTLTSQRIQVVGQMRDRMAIKKHVSIPTAHDQARRCLRSRRIYKRRSRGHA
jgi:hypothetical protein